MSGVDRLDRVRPRVATLPCTPLPSLGCNRLDRLATDMTTCDRLDRARLHQLQVPGVYRIYKTTSSFEYIGHLRGMRKGERGKSFTREVLLGGWRQSVVRRILLWVVGMAPGVLVAKVGYFGVKSAKVDLGPDGHQTC